MKALSLYWLWNLFQSKKQNGQELKNLRNNPGHELFRVIINIFRTRYRHDFMAEVERYKSIMDHEEEVWPVLQKSCLVVMEEERKAGKDLLKCTANLLRQRIDQITDNSLIKQSSIFSEDPYLPTMDIKRPEEIVTVLYTVAYLKEEFMNSETAPIITTIYPNICLRLLAQLIMLDFTAASQLLHENIPTSVNFDTPDNLNPLLLAVCTDNALLINYFKESCASSIDWQVCKELYSKPWATETRKMIEDIPSYQQFLEDNPDDLFQRGLRQFKSF